MTGRRLLAVAQAAIVLGGAGVIASTLRSDAPGGPAPAERTVTSGPRDPGDISANNSPSLAVNPMRPRQLAVANRIDTPRFGCALRTSDDGGANWRETRIPTPPGERRQCYAPDVAFGPDGTLHLLYLTLKGLNNAPNGLWALASTDGGRTLSSPRRIAGPLTFQPRIAVDPDRPRRVYATWLQARDVGLQRFTGPGNPIVLSRSDDGGRSWSRPARVSAPARGRVLAPTPAIGRGGDVYVLHLDLGDDRLDYEGGHDASAGPAYGGRFALVVARSQDGGGTWEESVVDDRIAPVERFVVFLPPSPSLAVDRRDGRVYAAFHDARLGDADVRVWTLAPGSSTWSGVRVNDTRERDGTAQYQPRLAVAPGGRLDVLYYDRRDDPGDRLNAVSLQSSNDGGRTFAPRIRVSRRSFDSQIGAGSERGLPDLGSRLALASSDARVTAVWTDTRWGSPASNKQDLVLATVAVGERRGGAGVGARDLLRYGGIALALLGLAGVATATRRTAA